MESRQALSEDVGWNDKEFKGNQWKVWIIWKCDLDPTQESIHPRAFKTDKEKGGSFLRGRNSQLSQSSRRVKLESLNSWLTIKYHFFIMFFLMLMLPMKPGSSTFSLSIYFSSWTIFSILQVHHELSLLKVFACEIFFLFIHCETELDRWLTFTMFHWAILLNLWFLNILPWL